MDEKDWEKLETEPDENVNKSGLTPDSAANGQDDLFASFFDADKIAADFDRMNLEIFGEEKSEEFAPSSPVREEIPDEAEAADDSPAAPAPAPAAPVRKAESKGVKNQSFVINVDSGEGPKGKKAEKKSKKEKAVKKSEKQESYEKQAKDDESLFSLLYQVIYSFGYDVIRYTKALVLFFIATVAKPFVIFFKALNQGKKKDKAEKRTFRHKAADLSKEMASLRQDSAAARHAFRMVWRDPERFRKAMKVYLNHVARSYSHVVKTVLNVLLPVAAAVVLAFTATYWNNLTFALAVNYKNSEIGCISDESVYMEAKDLIGESLDTGAYSFDDSGETLSDITSSLDASYKLKLVSLDELSDAQTICDKVIEESADSLTNACGIYIDGEFVGAIKNEMDARTVFYNYLQPYTEEAQEGGYVVGFAESVEYRQGIYSDTDSIIIDAEKLNEIIHSTKTVKLEYKASDSDTLETISLASGISEQRLIELNPDFDWDDIKSGDRINYEKETSFLRIQKTVVTTKTVSVPFETITTTDSTKYAGYSNVTRAGIEGTNKVTTTKIYVDDVLTSSTDDVTVITQPVSEIKTVGGISYYGAVVISTTSSSGFLWPAPSCNYISSSYGYRSSGFHTGVDLCRADGGANGTSVVASRDGYVEYAGWSTTGYGWTVLINHGDGFKTRYGHMQQGSLCVSTGDYVYAGQQLGRVGSTGNSTGPHLHFEVIYYGEKQNPMNYLSR